MSFFAIDDADGSRAKLSWTFVIVGKPIVKKNRKRIVSNRKTGKPFIASSTEYSAWEKTAIAQLRQQWSGRAPLEGEWNAAIITYLAARQRPDASNLYEGPQDALERAGVLNNDFQIVSHDGSRRRRDAANPRVEITLTYVGFVRRGAM